MKKVNSFFALVLSALVILLMSCTSNLEEKTGISFEIPVDAIKNALVQRDAGDYIEDNPGGYYLAVAKLFSSDGTVTRVEQLISGSLIYDGQGATSGSKKDEKVTFDFDKLAVKNTYSVGAYIYFVGGGSDNIPDGGSNILFYGKSDEVSVSRNKLTPVTVKLNPVEMAYDKGISITASSEGSSINGTSTSKFKVTDITDRDNEFIYFENNPTFYFNIQTTNVKPDEISISYNGEKQTITNYEITQEGDEESEIIIYFISFDYTFTKTGRYTVTVSQTDSETGIEYFSFVNVTLQDYKYVFESDYVIYNCNGQHKVVSSLYEAANVNMTSDDDASTYFNAIDTAFDGNNNLWYVEGTSTTVMCQTEGYKEIQGFNDPENAGYSPRAVAVDISTNELAVLGYNNGTFAVAVYNISSLTETTAPKSVTIIEDYNTKELYNGYPMAYANGNVYLGYKNDNNREDSIFKINLSTEVSLTVYIRHTLRDYITESSYEFVLNDIIYSEGNIYALVADKCNSSNQDEDQFFNSWGAILKYNANLVFADAVGIPQIKTVTTEAPYNYQDGDYIVAKPCKGGAATGTVTFNTRVPSSKDAKELFRPHRFIALKAKKLVFTDDGEFLYSNGDGSYNLETVSRIVTVDLSNFADSSLSITQSLSDYDSTVPSIYCLYNMIGEGFVTTSNCEYQYNSNSYTYAGDIIYPVTTIKYSE